MLSINNKLFRHQDICNALLIIFLFDSSFHITRKLFGGSNLGRLLILLAMIMMALVSVAVNKTAKIDCYRVSALVLCVFVLIGYFRSLLYGGNMDHAKTFIINGIIYYLFLPILYYSVDNIARAKTIITAVTVIGAITSLCSVILVVSHAFFAQIYYSLSSILYDYQVVVLLSDLGGIIRVCLSGMVPQVFGIFGGIYLYITEEKRKKYLLVIALNVFGILLTYARGLIGGTIIGLFVWIILANRYNGTIRKGARRIKLLGILGSLLALIYMVMGSGGRIIAYLFERFLGNSADTVASDLFRERMSSLINSKIIEAPLFGTGLGSHINLRDGAIEMTYQDIVIRMGIIGLIVFLIPFIITLAVVIQKKKNYNMISCVLCALYAVMIASYTNPYLITSNGIFIYCLCMRLCAMHDTESFSKTNTVKLDYPSMFMNLPHNYITR